MNPFTHCMACAAPLKGSWTEHEPDCPIGKMIERAKRGEFPQEPQMTTREEWETFVARQHQFHDNMARHTRWWMGVICLLVGANGINAPFPYRWAAIAAMAVGFATVLWMVFWMGRDVRRMQAELARKTNVPLHGRMMTIAFHKKEKEDGGHGEA